MTGSNSAWEAPVAVSLSEKLKDILERAILRGELEAGSKINAGRLAREMGVSVIPLREALRALAADGWVTLKPNIGAHVRERSLAEARDLHETRWFLESKIASLAAQRADPESLEGLKDLVIAGERAAEQGDTVAFAEINAAFHAAIASAAGNSVLAELHNRIALRVRFYFSRAVGQRIDKSAQEHSAIATAIIHRDTELAARLARDHASATQAALESVFSDASAGAEPEPARPQR